MFADRYKNYLSQYKHVENCVEFRIHSSNAIEKWKNNQTFQLRQIVQGKVFFNREEREITLLQYDMWSRFIYEVESFIIELGPCNDNVISAKEIEEIIILADKTFNTYKNILLGSESDNFNTAFNDLWLKGHEETYKLMLAQLRGFVGYNYNIAFSMLVRLITNVAQYSVMEVHELSNLINWVEDNDIDNPPFFFVSEMDETSFNITNDFLIVNRLKLYMKDFDIRDIYIKNYSGKKVPAAIFDKIEKLGITINYKLNY